MKVPYVTANRLKARYFSEVEILRYENKRLLKENVNLRMNLGKQIRELQEKIFYYQRAISEILRK